MDYDVIIIGSGPGGYVAAIRAAQLGLKTACVEKDPALGGTCLNVGCIPSKSLLHSTEMLYRITHHAKENGIVVDPPKADFAAMMTRKEGVVSGFNQGIAGLFKKNKVAHLQGHATFVDPHTIDVAGQQVSAKHFVIATGSMPTELPFLKFDEQTVLSSTGALALKEVPKTMTVIGAGVIGVELGSVYSRLGAQVEIVEFLDAVCPPLDRHISKAFEKSLVKQGLKFHLSTKVVSASVDRGVTLSLEGPGGTSTLSSDVVLVAIGRKPYTENLGLDKVGIALDQRGFIPINHAFQTTKSHIFAIGDVVGGQMLAHKASEEGIAVVELIAGKRPHIEYLAIPNVVYTDPEVAAVGFTEGEAKERSLPIKTSKFPFKANSRARCIADDEGMVKLIAHAETGTLLGAHIIGPHAGELIQECALAIDQRLTVAELARSPHPHPTLVEAIKEAALALQDGPIHM